MLITSQKKGGLFALKLKETSQTKGFILTDQVMCLDWKSPDTHYIEKIDEDLVSQAVLNLFTILI